MSHPWDIVRLTEAQGETAGGLINRAFVEEPIGHYMYPDPQERLRLLPSHFTLLSRYSSLFGEAYTTAGAPYGVALWSPPTMGATPERWVAAGVRRTREVLGAEAWERFWSVIDAINRSSYERDVPEQLWYLSLLAVDPPYQGRGIGSALVQPVLQQADASGLPCYLDTTIPRNLHHFQRHGFRVAKEGVESESGIRFWTMRRDPGGL